MLKKILAILFSLTLCLSVVPVFATGEAAAEIPEMKVIFEITKSEEVTETVGASPATSNKVFAYPIQQLESQVGGSVNAVLIHNAEHDFKVLMSMYKGDRLLSVDLKSVTADAAATADLRCSTSVKAPADVDVKDTVIKHMVWDENYAPVQEPAVISGADKRITGISGKDVRIFHGMGEIYSIFDDVEELEVTLADPDNCTWAITSANQNFKAGEFEITVTSNLDGSTAKYIVNPSYTKGLDAEQTHYLSPAIWESENPGVGEWVSNVQSYQGTSTKPRSSYTVYDWYWEGINTNLGNKVSIEKDALTGNKYLSYDDNSNQKLYLRGNVYYGGNSNTGAYKSIPKDKDYEFNIRTMNTTADLAQNAGIRFYSSTASSSGETVPNIRISFDAKGAVAFDCGGYRTTHIYAAKDEWMNIKAMLFRNSAGATKGYVYATKDGGEYKRSVDANSSIHFSAVVESIEAVHFSTHIGQAGTAYDIMPEGKIDYAVVRQIEE